MGIACRSQSARRVSIDIVGRTGAVRDAVGFSNDSCFQPPADINNYNAADIYGHVLPELQRQATAKLDVLLSDRDAEVVQYREVLPIQEKSDADDNT
jgi:hypothetical protein